MHPNRFGFFVILALVIATIATACGGGDGGTTAAGGTTGSGGSTSTGGKGGTGITVNCGAGSVSSLNTPSCVAYFSCFIDQACGLPVSPLVVAPTDAQGAQCVAAEEGVLMSLICVPTSQAAGLDQGCRTQAQTLAPQYPQCAPKG